MNYWYILLIALFWPGGKALAVGIEHKAEPKDTVGVCVWDSSAGKSLNIVVTKDTMTFKRLFMPTIYLFTNELQDIAKPHDNKAILHKKTWDKGLLKYVRESILKYFYYKSARKYKYYKHIDYAVCRDPEPPEIKVSVFRSDKRKWLFEHYNLPPDVKSKKPQDIVGARVVYTDEYARFLDALLSLNKTYDDAGVPGGGEP